MNLPLNFLFGMNTREYFIIFPILALTVLDGKQHIVAIAVGTNQGKPIPVKANVVVVAVAAIDDNAISVITTILI